MGDINNGHGDAYDVATFPVPMYVLIMSNLVLLLVPYLDMLHVLSLMCTVKYASAFVKFLLVIKLTQKLTNKLTIQKPYMLRQFSPYGFAVVLKPSLFTGSHFKRWQTKTLLWITSIDVHRVVEGTRIGPLTPGENNAFGEATIVFWVPS
jgi:hypothetical protein